MQCNHVRISIIVYTYVVCVSARGFSQKNHFIVHIITPTNLAGAGSAKITLKYH